MIIQGAVHRSLDIYLMTEENPGKPQLGDRLMKLVRSAIPSIGEPYFQMTSVVSYSRPGREKEGKKEGRLRLITGVLKLCLRFRLYNLDSQNVYVRLLILKEKQG